ncbi:MAG TPA: hypothetical protein DEB48_03825 [Verrucomicrobiales bacterium]|nr:hypothetical protein [Verrucomicrobiales bacterium]
MTFKQKLNYSFLGANTAPIFLNLGQLITCEGNQKKDRPGGNPKTTSQTAKFHQNKSFNKSFRMPRVEATDQKPHLKFSGENLKLEDTSEKPPSTDCLFRST